MRKWILQSRQFWSSSQRYMIERNVGPPPRKPLLHIGDDAAQAAEAAVAVEKAPLPKIFQNRAESPLKLVSNISNYFSSSSRNAKNEKQPVVKSQEVAEVIGGLREDWEACLRFFQWCSVHVEGHKHGIQEYNAVLWVLVAASQFDRIGTVLERMIKENCVGDRVTFALLLKCYARGVLQAGMMFEFMIKKLCEEGPGDEAQRYSEMVEFVDRTAAVKWTPTLSVYTVVVNPLVKNGHHGKAIGLRKRLLSGPGKPDFNVYKVLIIALCKARKLEGIQDLVDEMVEKTGRRPDFHMLTSLTTSCSRATLLGEAYHWYHEMQTRGYEPTMSTYNLLIDSLGKGGYVDWAYSVFEDMSKKSSGPEILTYNSLLAVLCRGDRADEAFRLFGRMKQSGATPDAVTYTILIDELGKSYKIEDACRLFVEMVDNGCTPDVVVQTAMVNALIKSEDAERASELFKYMADVIGRPFGASTFRGVIHGFTRAGRVPEAYYFFQDLKEIEGYATLEVYNHLIFHYSKSENALIAFKLQEDMRSRGVEPDHFTFRTLVDLFSRNGKLDRAEKFLAEMKAKGYVPDQVTYNKLIDMLGKTGDLPRSFKLMHEMEAAGHKADSYTYSSMLHNLGRQDKTDAAVKLFKAMENRGCEADSRTFNALVIALAKSDKVNEANEAHRIMKRRGFMPDKITYDELVQLNLRFNNPDIIAGLRDEMIGQGIRYKIPPPVYPSQARGKPEFVFRGKMKQELLRIEASKEKNKKPSKKQQPWKISSTLRSPR